ncbi:MAG TPA: hypothetical protein VHY79_16950, partial [Rhizomicrobium sp.]|nr:hypothetical protein [Rhizomicrobium sp.]
DNHGLPLAGLIGGKATIPAIFFEVRRPDVSAKVSAIHFRNLVFSANLAALEFFRKGFPQLVQHNPARLVRHAEVTGQRQRVFAFHFIDENRDGREIHPDRGLARRKQRAGREGKILAAFLAPEAEQTGRTAMLVRLQAATFRANRFALGFGPADFPESGFGVSICHPEHFRQRQCPRRFGLEEVDCHSHLSHIRYLSDMRYDGACQAKNIGYDTSRM